MAITQISRWWGSPGATTGLGRGHRNPMYWLGEETASGKQKCPAVLSVSCRPGQVVGVSSLSRLVKAMLTAQVTVLVAEIFDKELP